MSIFIHVSVGYLYSIYLPEVGKFLELGKILDNGGPEVFWKWTHLIHSLYIDKQSRQYLSILRINTTQHTTVVDTG